MNEITKNGAKYIKLRDDLAALVDQGRVRAVAAANEVLVESYWRIGARLSRELEIGEDGSARRLIERLAPDLEVGQSVLYRALQFFRAYPDGLPAAPELKGLGWGWHVELLPVGDPEQRRQLARLAHDNGWRRADLRQAVRQGLFSENKGRGRERGLLSQHLERPTAGMHTFGGVVERVVDGDTLIVRIDLGFDVWKSQRLRLRGIDTPDRETQAGAKAWRFVERRLKIGQEVVLRTYWLDKYGRYVADCFFGEEGKLVDREQMLARGRFLNQELLDKGHAVPLSG